MGPHQKSSGGPLLKGITLQCPIRPEIALQPFHLRARFANLTQRDQSYGSNHNQETHDRQERNQEFGLETRSYASNGLNKSIPKTDYRDPRPNAL
jgi:hypothetical protein